MTKLTLLSATAAAFCLITGTASAQTTAPDGAAGAFSKDTQSSSSSMPASSGATSAPSGAIAHKEHHRNRSLATGSGAAVSSGPSGSANTTSGPK